MPPQEEKANVGLAILSFLIPLAGLIIFLVEKDKKPKTAKTSGICALVSFILYIVFYVVIFVVGIVGSSVAYNTIQDEYSDYGNYEFDENYDDNFDDEYYFEEEYNF